MIDPYAPSKFPVEPASEASVSSTPFWVCATLIGIVGLGSLIGRLIGMRADYGQFGGYGHFLAVWLGGFAVYPGYIHGLLTFQGGDWVLCFTVALLNMAYYVVVLAVAFKRRHKNTMIILLFSYLISLGLNFLNFIFVALLHI